MKQAVKTRLVDDFLAAALEPERWLVALDSLAEATGSMRGQLIGIGGPRSFPFNWVTNLDDRAIHDLVEISGGSGKVNYRIAADRIDDPTAIKYETHYDQACSALDTNIYMDFCRDYDLPFGCQASILHHKDMLVGLALLRTRRDGRTTVEQRRLFASLVPHVKAAVCMQMAMENQGSALIAGAMEAMALPAFVLDGLGKVCAMTAGAEAALTEGNVLRVSDRTIRGFSPDEDRAIDAAISAAVSGRADRPGLAVIRPKDSLFDRVFLSVMRLPARPMNFGFVPHALAVLRIPGSSRGPGSEILRLAFNLTSAEAEVAASFAAGRSRSEIAAERGVSLETIKAQLKAMFVKIGVSREAELIVKLAQFDH